LFKNDNLKEHSIYEYLSKILIISVIQNDVFLRYEKTRFSY